MKVKVTSDKELATQIRAEIRANGGYCPCAIEHNDDTKCMCKAFRECNITGPCHCGLYIKTEV